MNMDKNKILAKNTIILGIGQFIPKIIAMITLPILTKAFTTDEYGIYDLIISFSSLAIPLMTLLIQQAVFRFLINEENEEKSKLYITNSIVFISLLSLSLFFIIIIVGSFIGIDLKLLIIAFLVYFAESLYDLFGQIARGYGKNILFSAAVIMYSVVNMILLVITVWINYINIINVLIIILISYIIALIFLALKLNITKVFDINFISLSVIKKLLIYSIPIIPSSISLWIVNLSDRVIITYFLGASYNGIYAASSKIPNLFGTIYNVFNLAWTELASRSIKENDISDYYSRLFNSLYSFLIGVMILLITVSPIMFDVLIDNKFSEGYFQIPILFIGVLLSCFVSFYGGLYIALKKTKQVGISSFMGCILNVVINIIFIKKIGIYAASISTLVSFLVILIYRFFETKRFIRIKYNYYNICIGIICLLISVFCFYKNNFLFFIFNIIITIIYNCFFNKFLISIKSIIVSKLKKKKLNI